jgi:hypothetical protein
LLPRAARVKPSEGICSLSCQLSVGSVLVRQVHLNKLTFYDQILHRPARSCVAFWAPKYPSSSSGFSVVCEDPVTSDQRVSRNDTGIKPWQAPNYLVFGGSLSVSGDFKCAIELCPKSAEYFAGRQGIQNYGF